MAESFYAGCCQGFWKTVIIGDPLMAPYASPPTVSISVTGTTLSEVEQITANASDEAGVGKVVFYLDNTKIGELYQAPFTLTIDTSYYPIGPHSIEAIAYENSAVGTQGSAKIEITIDNIVSTVSSIHDARMYPDGQCVRLETKVVTATTAEIGDGFYIEEADRASAIKVISNEPVARGDIVTVRGPVTTASGERVITVVDPQDVEIIRPGGQVPGPLMMRLCDLGGAAIGDFTSPVGRGCGARNTSLLVRVAGRVTSSGTGGFCVTDGSTPSPIKVVCPAGVQLPPVGTWVVVTGISTAEPGGVNLRASITVRNGQDIRIL